MFSIQPVSLIRRLINNDFNATVLLTPGCRIVGGDWLIHTETPRCDSVRGNTFLCQVLLNRFRTLSRQPLVKLGAANIIGMAFDLNIPLRVLLQKGHQLIEVAAGTPLKFSATGGE